MYINRKVMIEKNLSISDVSHSSNAMSTLVTSTTNQVIPGSTISYTPANNASKVVYDFHMQFHDGGTSHNLSYLQIEHDLVGDGTWTALGASYRLSDAAVYSNFQGLSVGRFFLAPWSGSRSLRLIINTYSSSYQNTLHEDEAGNHFDPIIKVYSLM